ncbi:hypothetical protein P879_02394 [Paragonimus westermani]|uniref:DNA-directed RNA polymerase subunit n=1 Tax=Paragonimus westermani TaxID=34504 RepID=A0A8T0DTE4_9TREM|nr:hypothetical protein P879_02394 [Paragonimus westermani]
MFACADGQIASLRFRFYTPAEVKAVSVRRVTNELAFDKCTGRGVDGGLHDASLGLHSEKDLCGHCGLDYFTCPGHFGHIEFAKPVFNPLFFDLLFKLMKSFCFSCFRLYGADYLSAALHYLGAPVHTLPGKPKQIELAELEGASNSELRIVALRALAARPRTPCKLCGSRSWVLRHINKQQLLARPVSENTRNKKWETNANDDEEGIEEVLAMADVTDPRSTPHISAMQSGEEVNLFVDSQASKTCQNMETVTAEMFDSVRRELQELANSCGTSKESCLLPEISRLLLRCLWANDALVLCLLFPMLSAATKHHQFATDIFFLDAVLLSPSICRLPRYVGGLAFEHPETAIYSRVVRRTQCLSHIVEFIEQQRQEQHQQQEESNPNQGNFPFEQPFADLSKDSDSSLVNVADIHRAEGALKLASVLLQAAVNGLYDSNTASIPAGLESKTDGTLSRQPIRLPGLRQRLEKKEGLFRMHMMGKRVNYTCRSVISPDPNLDVTEVGVPLFFACRLTFPTPVTAHNLEQLRQLVANGPDVYPGARSLQTPEGRLIHLPRGDTVQMRRKREILARRLTPVSAEFTGLPYVVNRHLLDHDMLVMNRQPTLHRPSMQAHCVRIIHSTEAKTLRMHYSNCRAYNADFDGDEMNGHLVQSYKASAELETLASVPYQYLSAKDGAPLAGLIQDHVIAAVKLTMRDRFLTHTDYLDLVYHALRSLFISVRQDSHGPPELLLLEPAIMWPQRLWTGKQVISTLLMNLTPAGMPHLNCSLRGQRTKAELWSGAAPGHVTPLTDVDVIVCDGYLASGMLDKSQIGSSSGGLVHCVYETYGPRTAAHLLNGISLLANRLLKFTAFTMSIKDMLLSADANHDRRRRFANLRDLGLCAFADAFELDPDALSESEVRRLYRQAHFAPSTDQTLCKRMLQLDNAMKNRLKRAQDAVCDAAIPSGLYVGFPENNLQLMVHVGAKGGMVNAQQMSVALGQIELEGRRVPLMLSGRSLPSFPPYDVRPRAGGMCTHRFLTSLSPQELFFHSMAGRDGLVDTAVKTSRSGYLQRSAIKHLEDLSIQYDGTVRDCGNNIVQFRYGDDGVDVCQASFLQQSGLHLFADNAALLSTRWHTLMGGRQQHVAAYQRLLEQNTLPRPLQVIADQVGIQRQMILVKSLSQNKLLKLFRKAHRAKAVLAETIEQQKQLSRTELLNADLPEAPCEMADALRALCLAKLISAQAPPGDPVGLLAAQSVGEPSTQMTLNTFHFAGRGEMNVTLGIPRLREILMSGSSVISTPCMEVPVRPTNEARRCCMRISKRFYKLKLVEAVRRRRLEVEAEEDTHLGGNRVIDLDEVVDLDIPDEDDEVAELRELGVDPDHMKEDDYATEKEDEFESVDVIRKGKAETLKPQLPKTSAKEPLNTSTMEDMGQEAADLEAEEQELEPANEQSDNENKSDEDAEFELESRKTFVTRLHARFSKYDFDRSDPPKWARLTICMFDPKEGRISIDLKTLVMRIVNKSVVSSVPGIEKVIVDRSSRSKWMFRVEGINMNELMRYPGVFDLTQLYTNSIAVMGQTYGIEAARASIQKEVSGVFGHYGIHVNSRHLSLIADYMTKSGVFRAFNRMAFTLHPSPLQRMSFETVVNALKETIQEDRMDSLVSPSASIVTGRIVHNAGTNCFDLCQKLIC